MFNLEQSIAEWRRQMTAAGIKSPVPLDELETHLREETDRQVRSGTNSERAFETAVRKIGPASALQSEFKKVDAARKERARALEQKVLFVLANLMPSLMCGRVLFKSESISQMTSGQQMSCLAAGATVALFVWSGRLGHRLFPVIHKRATGVIVGLGGVFLMLWAIVFMNLILPRYDFTLGPLLVGMYWALFTPVGVFCGLAWGIKTAAQKKSAVAVS